MPSIIETTIDDLKAEKEPRKLVIKRGRIQRFPKGLEQDYIKYLKRRALRLMELTRVLLYPSLPNIVDEARSFVPKGDSIRLDDYADDIDNTVDAIKVSFERETNEADVNYFVTNIASKTSVFNKEEILAVLKSKLGVDLFLGDENYLVPKAKAWINNNISLIKTIEERYLPGLEFAINDGIRQGKTVAEIKKNIFNNYTKSRWDAERIARDQIGKFNAELTEMRQLKLGIKQYRWRTSLDERVRGNPFGLYKNAKPSHYAREGKLYSWKKPPSGGHPGQAILCRCYADPYLEKFL